MRSPRELFATDRESMAERPTSNPLPADRTAAVTELFDRHYPGLVRLARLLVDDEETAEDVVMDAFMALHQRWSAIRDPGQAYGYVRSCVLNGSRSRLRHRKVTRSREGMSLIDVPTTDDPATQSAQRAVVMQVLRQLPVRQRQVLVLRYYLDLSEAEIARELHIGVGSVKTHASRGLAAVSRALEARHED